MVGTRYSGITQAAQQENNWGLFRVVDGRKKPWCIDAQRVVGKDDALVYTLPDVIDQVDENEFWLGYCPRPGSAYVALDFDHVLEDDDYLVAWADEIIGDWQGKDGVTPSGEGLRVLLPRCDDETDRAHTPEMQSERAGLGYYGGGGIAVTVPVDCLSREDDDAHLRDMLERFWQRMEENKIASAGEGGQSVATQDREWHKWWMSRMSDNEQAEAVGDMIQHFGDVSDRHDWLGFMFACKSLQDYVTCDVFNIWDGVCIQYGGYNAEENEYQWHKAGDKKDGGTSWLWLRSKARQNNWPEHKWEPRRDMEQSVLGGLAREAPQFDERVEQVEQRDWQRRTNDEIMDEVWGRYVYNETDNRIYDLEGTNMEQDKAVAGVKMVWKAEQLHEINEGGEECWINPIDRWLGEVDMKITDVPPYMDPRQPAGFVGERRGFINTYKPFQPTLDNVQHPEMFLRLVHHVFPGDADYILDWMAYKLQTPWSRGFAVVNYTATKGTGRGTLFDMFSEVLGHENCMPMSSERAFGKNSNQFNTFMGKLLVTIAEVDEGTDEKIGNLRAIYNRLKQLVEPDQKRVTIEGKNANLVSQEVFTSWLIATNLSTALPIDPDDRRFYVARGNDRPLRVAHPDVIQWLRSIDHGQARTAALSDIWNYLMMRDVSAYDFHTPADSAMKVSMAQDAKPIIDILMEEFTQEHPVFTANLAMLRLKRHPDLEGMKEDSIKRQINGWTKAHSFVPADVTGGKLKVAGYPHRVRVVRGSGEGVAVEGSALRQALLLLIDADGRRLKVVKDEG